MHDVCYYITVNATVLYYTYKYVQYTAQKTIFFPNVLKRWYFQKNCVGIWSFLYYRERWYFFFPKIWSYTLNRKWKVSFLKNTRKYDIFFRLNEKMVFPKRAAPAHDLSCIIWKDRIFSRKQIFSSGRKWKEAFLRKYMEGWYIALQQRKIGNLIYRTEVWLLLKFIRLEIWKIFNTLHHSAIRNCVWRCAWAPIKEIICPLGNRL